MSESHVAKYFDLALDDCFIKSSSDSGDELNIQIIENGRPLFAFVKVSTANPLLQSFKRFIFLCKIQNY